MRNITLLILSLSLSLAVSAQCTSPLVSTGIYPGLDGPAQYVVSIPPATCFNGDVILYAHGYVAPGSPADAWTSQLALPDGTSLPALVNSLGFGFAASSFSKDGLAIIEGIHDTKALVGVISGLYPTVPVHKYFVTGVSEGGLVAAKSVEDDASYSGGVAVCGPIGSFQKQIDYFGDVRVLFDYFFPGVLSSAGGSAIQIPASLMTNWPAYEAAVVKALNANPIATIQLLSTAKIPIGLSYSNATGAIAGALWYNVFATNDATETLGGNPYANIGRVYTGSLNDSRLNAKVARFAESSQALTKLPAYETIGLLSNPLVTLHTLADPVVPFWQETLYGAKAAASAPELAQIPVLLRYGHCNVTATNAVSALVVLLAKAGL